MYRTEVTLLNGKVFVVDMAAFDVRLKVDAADRGDFIELPSTATPSRQIHVRADAVAAIKAEQ